MSGRPEEAELSAAKLVEDPAAPEVMTLGDDGAPPLLMGTRREESPEAPAPLDRALTTQVIALIVGLGLASGALGALLSTRLLRPAPPVRVGVVSLTRISRAIASTGTDPGTAAGFGATFDAAVRRLVQAEPGLVLFVKEAVIDTGGIEDYTDALLPLFSERLPPPSPRPGEPARQPGGDPPDPAQPDD